MVSNPTQTIVRGGCVGLGGKGLEIETTLGGADLKETTGPTAAAFGRTEAGRKSLYVTTTGSLVVSVRIEGRSEGVES